MEEGFKYRSRYHLDVITVVLKGQMRLRLNTFLVDPGDDPRREALMLLKIRCCWGGQNIDIEKCWLVREVYVEDVEKGDPHWLRTSVPLWEPETKRCEGSWIRREPPYKSQCLKQYGDLYSRLHPNEKLTLSSMENLQTDVVKTQLILREIKGIGLCLETVT